jgi:hypothetical protein
VTGAIEQAWVILQNRNPKPAELKLAVEQARKAVAELDSENDRVPEREARVLAGMTGTSIAEALKALGRLANESADRALVRKVDVAIAEQLEHRLRELEAIESAKPPEQRRREQEQAEREAKLRGLYARVPALFRSDFVVSKLGKAAFSRTPAPQGRQVSYIRSFDVPRALQHLMTATKVQGWPPKHGDFARIEWPNSEIEEDETIVGPLRLLCEKSSPSEDELQIAIDRAQATLLNEFGRVCTEIRRHYPEGLPRFIVLPSLGPTAMAAE